MVKKNFCCFILGFYLSILAVLPLDAGGDFLKIGVGERPSGMGEAFSAVADNVNAIYWNPAGLAQLSRPEFSLMHMQYVLTEFRVNYLGFALPLNPGRDLSLNRANRSLGVVGFDLRVLTNKDTYRDENGNTTGKFMNYNGVGTLAYSLPVGKNYLAGVALKYFYEQYEQEKIDTVLLDLGTMYKTGWPDKNILRVGIIAQNIGINPGIIFPNFKLGVSYAFSFGPLLALDLDFPTRGTGLKYSTGLEYLIFNKFALRTGYRLQEKARFASGFTIGMGFKILKYGIDYAYIPYGDLGMTNRLSISGRF